MSAAADPNFPDGLDIKVNRNLKTKDINQRIEEYGIAGRVWEAADVLLDYFSSRDSVRVSPMCSIFDFKTNPNARGIVELGSGTGYVGLKLSEMLHVVDLGRRDDLVILTDLPDVCRLLMTNLTSLASGMRCGSFDNGLSLDAITKIAPLSWGNLDDANSIVNRFLVHPPATDSNKIVDRKRELTHIVCSDLVYFPSLYGPLLRTFLHLTSPPICSQSTSLEIIIGYKIRSLAKETPFWTAFGLWFEYEPVLQLVECIGNSRSAENDSIATKWRLFGQSSQSEDRTFVFIARRRSESTGWTIPSEDEDLVAGVGAYGTDTHKGDDYFETLLLMQVDLSDD